MLKKDCKLAYISTYSPQPCGIATYTEYLINGLMKLKKDLSIRVIAESKAEHYKNNFIEVLPVWNRFNDYSKPIIKYSKGFDIIHLQHEFGIFQFDNRIIKMLNGLNEVGKKIVTFHCIKPKQFADSPTIEAHIKAVANLADLNIVHLPAQQAVLTRLGIERKKIRLIPHGTELINIDKKIAREKLNLPIAGKILLMFGFVKAHKGYEIVLDSLREIIKYFPDTYFFIAGTLPSKPQKSEIKYLNYLKRRINALHLTKQVIFPNKF
ncbi:MAG: glycosyltransferase, partial [candidate division WOR-3 bacterium]